MEDFWFGDTIGFKGDEARKARRGFHAGSSLYSPIHVFISSEVKDQNAYSFGSVKVVEKELFQTRLLLTERIIKKDQK